MTDSLLLLQAGNKKAKQLRDENQKIYEFLIGRELLSSEELLAYGFDVDALFYMGIGRSCTRSELEGAFKNFLKDDDFDRFREDCDISWYYLDRFFSKLNEIKSGNRDLMQDFYALKSQIVLKNFQPIEIHKSKHFHSHWSDYDEDVVEAHDYFVLFERSGFQFHIPYDEVCEVLGEDVVDSLPTTQEIGQISSDLDENHPYTKLSLSEVIDVLRKETRDKRALARQKLKEIDPNNTVLLGITGKIAAPFNRWVKKEFPNIYAAAKTIINEHTRHSVRYSRDYVLTWIHHPVLPPMDAYRKSPTKAELLADICFLLMGEEYDYLY